METSCFEPNKRPAHFRDTHRSPPCESTSSPPCSSRFYPPLPGESPGAPAELTESLLVDDQKVISNEDIQRVLAAKITLSDDAMLAVALLIDTRTGVIPFSTIVTEDFAARRTRDDVDFSETIAKAEQQAIARAQLAMAEQVVQFSDGLGEQPPR